MSPSTQYYKLSGFRLLGAILFTYASAFFIGFLVGINWSLLIAFVAFVLAILPEPDDGDVPPLEHMNSLVALSGLFAALGGTFSQFFYSIVFGELSILQVLSFEWVDPETTPWPIVVLLCMWVSWSILGRLDRFAERLEDIGTDQLMDLVSDEDEDEDLTQPQ